MNSKHCLLANSQQYSDYKENMESFETPWCSWCRLCAREDTENSVSIYQSLIVDENDLTLEGAMEKYFWVQISSEDLLPKHLCLDCHSLISSIMLFNENVERVQQMYRFLVDNRINDSWELQSVRFKFGVCDARQRSCSPNKIIESVSQTDGSKNENCEAERLTADIKQENWAIDDDNASAYKEEILYDEESTDEPIQKDDIDPFDTVTDDCFWGEDEMDPKARASKRYTGSEDANTVRASKHKISESQLTDIPCKKIKAITEDFVLDVTCAICEQKFELYSAYCEHMEESHDNANLDEYCPLCDRTLQTWYHLGRHMRIHMPVESRYPIKCPECENRYTTTALLEVHINHKHKKEKPFICEVCGFCGGTKNSLTQHMYKHTDNAPFECEVCKKRFKKKSHLNFHMDIHGPDKFVCTICGQQLNSRATLRNHFLVHSDEKRHKCDYCGSTFKQSKSLKSHLLLHTELMPYSCNFCDLTFRNLVHCRAHMGKMHPDELSLLETSGNKAYTKTVPRLETLREVTKSADNLRPVGQPGRYVVDPTKACLPCKFCDRRFPYRSSRHAHMKTKHADEFALLAASENKTHTRNISKMKKEVAKAANHKEPTEPLPCDFCVRTFVNRKCWRNHMKKIHSDELVSLDSNNIPKSDTLSAITKAVDILIPVDTKFTDSSTNVLQCMERPTSPLDLTPCASTTTATNIQDLFYLID